MYSVHPRAGERYYLRVLLLYVTVAKSYEDIRTVKEKLCEAFMQPACVVVFWLTTRNGTDVLRKVH